MHINDFRYVSWFKKRYVIKDILMYSKGQSFAICWDYTDNATIPGACMCACMGYFGINSIPVKSCRYTEVTRL